MRCENCGVELLPEDKFCGECGAPRPSSARPATLPERGADPPRHGVPSLQRSVSRAAPGAAVDGPLPGRSKEYGHVRRFLLPILALAAVGLAVTVAVAVGWLALRSGRLDVIGRIRQPAAEPAPVPAGQVSLAAFQAAARECRPVAAVTGIYEGIELDVLISVERQVRDACEITMEVIDDRTGYELVGKHMTCRIPMEALAGESQPAGDLGDYCRGPLVDAVTELSQEGR